MMRILVAVMMLLVATPSAAAQSIFDSFQRGWESGGRDARARNEEARRQAEFDAQQRAIAEARARRIEWERSCATARDAGVAWADARDLEDKATLTQITEPSEAEIMAFRAASLERRHRIADGYARCISSNY